MAPLHSLVGLSVLAALLCLSLLLLLASTPVAAEYCHGSPSPSAQPNAFPITLPVPTFVRSVANGSLWEVLVHDQQIPLLHLYGDPYAKGFAAGQLTGERLATFSTELFAYLVDDAAGVLNKSGMPWPEAQAIVEAVLDFELDLTSWETGPYTGTWYGEELRGLADGSGLSLDLLRRMQMLGELNKGSCSMFGAWGPSLQGSSGLLTMRALDWIMDGPFQDYSQLTVYHADPNNAAENTFLTMGWAGWIGSITGVNDQLMSIHEIGVSYPDASFGQESTQGVPFTYVLRDILQFDRTRLDALSRLAGSHRTCDLILGVGDGKDSLFNSVAYSASSCQLMNDLNLKPLNSSWHPRLRGVVYHAMDWLCPAYNKAMAQQIESLYGQITPALAISQIMPIVQTGNLHIFVADLVAQQFFVSFAASSASSSNATNAFDRQFAQLDLPSIFTLPPPNENQWQEASSEVAVVDQ